MIEVLKQMVEALENPNSGLVPHGGEWHSIQSIAIQAGKQVIAELGSQEPVCPECKAEVLYECVACSRNNYPPQRTWVGLTPDELNTIGDSMKTWNSFSITDVYFAIEAKLKERNT